MKPPIILGLAATALLVAAPVFGQYKQGTTPPPQSSAARADMADGEVRRIDKAKGTILIKHGEIKSINMAPMTMGFKLQDPKMADGLAVGDKIRFVVAQKGDELIVTHVLKVQ